MSVPPGGTITFLFTDIEGSTPLWESKPEAMKEALACHHAILRQAIESNHGFVFQIVGDSFQAAFASASHALVAALTAQRSLAQETWRDTGPLRVRMGLHTGLAELIERDYTSNHTLNRVSRVMSAAFGSQILLSQETADLVFRGLPPGVTLKDLGDHLLKGLSRPEHLFQVVAPDLLQYFPLLPTRIERPNNLPPQLTSFGGREAEIAAICEKLLRPEVRLLTLTGVGGTGKTRISLQVGQQLLEYFPYGVFFVHLAAVREVHLVIPSIAEALGLHESSDHRLSTC
jgi:class 3 adenylate cyclase